MQVNVGHTQEDIAVMGERLAEEIVLFISNPKLKGGIERIK
jgi:hypothetical protein